MITSPIEFKIFLNGFIVLLDVNQVMLKILSGFSYFPSYEHLKLFLIKKYIFSAKPVFHT